MTQDNREKLTPEEKKQQLFLNQKKTLAPNEAPYEPSTGGSV